ncbi:MAG TPA: DUF1801 domain-containing protein [Candidatus Polarisedimenticolaceae bacterium]|nr:DUF1801 domain-containing protein [Candidatus Polarisedimenticolaceae bacterium]
MKKATAPTTPTAYIAAQDEPKRTELRQLHQLIRRTVPSMKPYIQSGMGDGMIGYGRFPYKAGNKYTEWFRVGLASNKTGMSVYVCAGDAKGYFPEQAGKRLGKVMVGKSCIRFKKLADLNTDVLVQVLKQAETVHTEEA